VQDDLDVDVFFADRRMGYHSGGAARSVSHPVPDLYYRGYAHLPELGQEAWVSQIGGFRELYEGIRDHYAKERPLAGCDGLMAVAVQRVLHSVLLSASDGGRLVSF